VRTTYEPGAWRKQPPVTPAPVLVEPEWDGQGEYPFELKVWGIATLILKAPPYQREQDIEFLRKHHPEVVVEKILNTARVRWHAQKKHKEAA